MAWRCSHPHFRLSDRIACKGPTREGALGQRSRERRAISPPLEHGSPLSAHDSATLLGLPPARVSRVDADQTATIVSGRTVRAATCIGLVTVRLPVSSSVLHAHATGVKSYVHVKVRYGTGSPRQDFCIYPAWLRPSNLRTRNMGRT